jgi:TolB protein
MNFKTSFFALILLCSALFSSAQRKVTSFIHTVDIYTEQIDTVLKVDEHYEAPNWHPDGYLILNKKVEFIL